MAYEVVTEEVFGWQVVGGEVVRQKVVVRRLSFANKLLQEGGA